MKNGLPDSPIALVTGGARGIGMSIGLELLTRGCRVILVDREDISADQAAGRKGGVLLNYKADVTNIEDLRSVVRDVGARLGPITILVNNAGISLKNAAGQSNGLLDLTIDEWERTVSVNLTAPMRLSQLVIPIMRDFGWGRIVNLASTAGRTNSRVAGPSYMATKAGLIGLTRSIANEVGRFGITANCVAPGRILTEMSRQAGDDVNARYAAQIPTGRLGTPEDVAAAVAYLCSEQASFVNGAIIDVTGGSFMP
ncbi:3-oxoacyl-ACP reductase FabG [Ferrovibrio sp.]|uniref:3-oxoacyl-ACP reductase FabG n=1 Tax=Ferrovibrio sp. TaxID=1917215 RepID=UPI003D1434BD